MTPRKFILLAALLVFASFAIFIIKAIIIDKKQKAELEGRWTIESSSIGKDNDTVTVVTRIKIPLRKYFDGNVRVKDRITGVWLKNTVRVPADEVAGDYKILRFHTESYRNRHLLVDSSIEGRITILSKKYEFNT